MEYIIVLDKNITFIYNFLSYLHFIQVRTTIQNKYLTESIFTTIMLDGYIPGLEGLYIHLIKYLLNSTLIRPHNF